MILHPEAKGGRHNNILANVAFANLVRIFFAVLLTIALTIKFMLSNNLL